MYSIRIGSNVWCFSNLYLAWNRFEETARANIRHGGGCERATPRTQFIVNTARRNRTLYASGLRAHTGIHITLSTIRRRCTKVDLEVEDVLGILCLQDPTI